MCLSSTKQCFFQDTLPHFTIDQKDDTWELSINTTKPENEETKLKDREYIENNVIKTANNVIKAHPKDPLITSYQSTHSTHQTTSPPVKVTASSIRDKNNNYYNIAISEDQEATDLSIFQFLKNIVKIPAAAQDFRQTYQHNQTNLKLYL